METNKIDLKDTLNLPKTDFPMKGDLVKREPERLAKWEEIGLYDLIQNKNLGKPKFILHDGPPFTNGDVHIGTALNKILKDIIVRFKSMSGFSAPYVPGWDCHGLPIEHKVMKENKDSVDVLEIRKKCDDFSESYIPIQKKQFKRLGILADWKNEYKTKDFAYEAQILRVFKNFVEQDLIYRSKKPIYWSIPCKTALAEAEIEYKNHVSDSIWVAFKVLENSKNALKFSKSTKGVYFVIWTTTPWTIPANKAIAVHPDFAYVTIELDDKIYIVSEALAEKFISECKLQNAKISSDFSGLVNFENLSDSCENAGDSNRKLAKKVLGRHLSEIETKHPFMDVISPIILAEHVTTESGTGCVHTAPGHGQEDYIIGLKYNLEIYSPLNDDGCYINDPLIPQELIGLSVFEKIPGKSEANERVLKILREKGALVHSTKCEHSYPFCWRSKTPVIFRAMDQWFINLNKSGLRERTLKAIENVQWVPEWGMKRIQGAVEHRPDWCISRQRSWGVPIPVFFDEQNNPLLSPEIIESIAKKVEKYGSNIWFSEDESVLLKDVNLPPEWQGKILKKSTDTLDVWIDSGSSHLAVLKQKDFLSWPADLYLEGSDQHRGWFQSSLWMAMVSCGQPPYKKVITHGFFVDENRQKISKSDGKPQTADSYVNRFGADIIRLWVASENYQDDIPVSEDILKHVVNTYRTIRNTIRFQLGNTHDFDYEKNSIEYSQLDSIDKWALHQTYLLVKEISECYESFSFHKIYQKISYFCSIVLSANYHDILKDRLYTHGIDWKSRRSSQTVICKICETLLKLLSPILPMTTDEAYSFFAKKDKKISVHLEDFPKLDQNWFCQEKFQDIESLLKFKLSYVNENLEKLRQNGTIGQSLDAKIVIEIPEQNQFFKLLKNYEDDLPELWIVSQVEIITCENDLNVSAKHAEGERCPRSWRWVNKLVECDNFGKVSERCFNVLNNKL